MDKKVQSAVAVIASKAKQMKKIKITLVKSPIDRPER